MSALHLADRIQQNPLIIKLYPQPTHLSLSLLFQTAHWALHHPQCLLQALITSKSVCALISTKDIPIYKAEHRATYVWWRRTTSGHWSPD